MVRRLGRERRTRDILGAQRCQRLALNAQELLDRQLRFGVRALAVVVLEQARVPVEQVARRPAQILVVLPDLELASRSAPDTRSPVAPPPPSPPVRRARGQSRGSALRSRAAPPRRSARATPSHTAASAASSGRQKSQNSTSIGRPRWMMLACAPLPPGTFTHEAFVGNSGAAIVSTGALKRSA